MIGGDGLSSGLPGEKTGRKELKLLQLNLIEWRSTVSFLLNRPSFGPM